MYGVAASNSAAQVSTRLKDGVMPNSIRLARTSASCVPAKMVRSDMWVGGLSRKAGDLIQSSAVN